MKISRLLALAALLGALAFAVGFSLPASAAVTKNILTPVYNPDCGGRGNPSCNDQPIHTARYCCRGDMPLVIEYKRGKLVTVIGQCRLKTAGMSCNPVLLEFTVNCTGMFIEDFQMPTGSNTHSDLLCVN